MAYNNEIFHQSRKCQPVAQEQRKQRDVPLEDTFGTCFFEIQENKYERW